jgi:hypothetical protein
MPEQTLPSPAVPIVKPDGSGRPDDSWYQRFVLMWNAVNADAVSLEDAVEELTPIAGSLVQSAYAEYLTNAALATTIPLDDSIPQSGEGTEVLTCSITPTSATNKLRVRVSLWGSIVTSGSMLIAAVFRDAGADAVHAATAGQEAAAGWTKALTFEFEVSASSTAATTFKLNVGANSGGIRLNGSTSARYFGGVSRTTLVIEEIKV